MQEKRVLIVGSGKRVREAALPALQQLGGRFAIEGIYARTAKRIEARGVEYEVLPLDELPAASVRAADLLYLAVGKDAVPAVLDRLEAFEAGGLDLLIDTPVVRFKHFRHAARLGRFRHVWVAEDCVELPWLDVVREAVAGGALGELRRAVFFQSAYAYHAVATLKAVLGSPRVLYGRRRRLGRGFGCRSLRFAGGRAALLFEPRDYAVGRFLLVGTRGSISDYPLKESGNLLLEPVVSDGACRGFRLGDHASELAPGEVELMGAWGTGAGADGVTARMEDMKRVGFLRLLEGIHAGRGGYPVREALDDMVVDYYLEKLGTYVASPLTSAKSALGRWLLGAVTRAAGR